MSASRPDRILLVHNHYQHKGGEDGVVQAERWLLEQRGHSVDVYGRHNDDIGGSARLGMAVETIWSSRTLRDVRARIDAFEPDILHVHNTFPLISPSVYWAADAAGVPVVQTLHNFRLVCPQAMFLRDNRICEDCLGRVPWRGVVRACYRGSVAQSGVAAAMLAVHRLLGTYSSKVARYIALNEFCRGKLVAGGLPAARIVVKPNFAAVAREDEVARSGGLYVGRLSPEKGIAVLARALQAVPAVDMRIVGDGPQKDLVSSLENARALGYQSKDVVLGLMRRAAYFVLPSVCYESMPLTLIEAFACGLPIIAGRLGALAELIDHGKTGLLFAPGSARELQEAIEWAEANPAALREMGRNARLEYERKYSPQANYERLIAIYHEALDEFAVRTANGHRQEA